MFTLESEVVETIPIGVITYDAVEPGVGASSAGGGEASTTGSGADDVSGWPVDSSGAAGEVAPAEHPARLQLSVHSACCRVPRSSIPKVSAVVPPVELRTLGTPRRRDVGWL